MSDYLMHFNPYHDPKNGQFASGGTHGKIRNLIVSNELGKIDQRQRAALKGAAAGKKIRDVFSTKSGKEKNQVRYEQKRKEIIDKGKKEYERVKNYSKADITKKGIALGTQLAAGLALYGVSMYRLYNS